LETAGKPTEFATDEGSPDQSGEGASYPNATGNQVLVEQVRQLYGRGKAGSVVVFIALIALWLPFLPQVAIWTILPPLAILLCAQLSFNLLRERYLNSDSQVQNPRLWGERYMLVCLLSGSAWGMAAVLWLPDAPFPEQALFCLIIAALCLNSILSRHVYPRALIAYAATAIGPSVVTLALDGTVEATITAGLALLACSVANVGLNSLYRSSEETIALRFQNNALIDRLAESTIIAEQKARDAESGYAMARKAARSRRDFLSMVAHEIRSPLASLTGLVDLLSATKLDADQKGYAKGVQESGRLLNRLVDDLADLTEMEALSINLRPVDISPADIARAAVRLMRHEAAALRLSLEIDVLPDTPATIHNDPDRVKQTLVNLITRALRTTENGGVIVRLSPVDIRGEEPGVRFSVTDTGEGMPPEEAARLFSRNDFEDTRSHSQIQRQDVNLTICDRLVRLMGGRIGADSRTGDGFTAWFILACDFDKPNDDVVLETVTSQSGQVLDLDKVYEIEQDLGTGRIADHLDEIIGSIADMQKSLAEACRKGDLQAARSTASELAQRAETIGLTGLAETASSLLTGVDVATSQVALNEKAAKLGVQFRAGAHALARAYPALAR
jgi:signal transduction histidine kinase